MSDSPKAAWETSQTFAFIPPAICGHGGRMKWDKNDTVVRGKSSGLDYRPPQSKSTMGQAQALQHISVTKYGDKPYFTFLVRSPSAYVFVPISAVTISLTMHSSATGCISFCKSNCHSIFLNANLQLPFGTGTGHIIVT